MSVDVPQRERQPSAWLTSQRKNARLSDCINAALQCKSPVCSFRLFLSAEIALEAPLVSLLAGQRVAVVQPHLR